MQLALCSGLLFSLRFYFSSLSLLSSRAPGLRSFGRCESVNLVGLSKSSSFEP